MRTFASAGETVAVRWDRAWVGRLVDRAVAGGAASGRAGRHRAAHGAGPTSGVPDRGGAPAPTVRICVQADRSAFDTRGMRLVTRGVHSDGARTVLHDVGGSGFDLLVTVTDDLDVTARYRPRPAVRLANRLLAARFRLLAGQVLVHYPVLWRAGWRGRVPLHACVVRTASGTVLLAGPGGVGKSTVLARLLASGAVATADNLCVADERDCYGLAEPLRIDGAAVPGVAAVPGAGTRTTHGRVEAPLPGRVPLLRPDRVVTLERGPATEVVPASADDAARALVAGTYAAGELRRYWAFAATLALATGRGPAHPPIDRIAAGYASRLPCLRLRAGDGAAVGDAELFPPAAPAGPVAERLLSPLPLKSKES